MPSQTKVIILAAGKGKRMGGDIPKVLIELNKKPLISYLLNSLKLSRIMGKPTVIVGFRADMVKEELKDTVEYVFQEEQLGTGHAVMCAKDNIGTADKIVVLYGDMPNIKPETIDNLLELHNNERPVLTMMTIKIPNFENEYAGFMGFGRVIRGEDGSIKKIVELRDADEKEKKVTELNPSLFCFNSSWILSNLSKLTNKNAQEEYYLTDLVGLAIEQGQKISSLEISPMECIGVNTPEELKFAEQILI
ncbi:NTP transferase domain-containing protein [Patescibacteria group bacterium]|nr:NTP transferase domain-containing protein [Patescibacteria group bacterium]